MKANRGIASPGAVVAAAFIGPGTVTTATLAGGNFGFTLLWAVAFSVMATLILQEMTARLGVIGRLGLGDAILQKTQGGRLYLPAALLVICAIFLGNAAYEAGNITGATVGLPPLRAGDINLWGFAIGALAFAMLTLGRPERIEQTLIALVICMAIVFISTAILVAPPIADVIAGLLVPTIPNNAALVIVGLIGTTVVPYNMFLYASTLKRHTANGLTLKQARRDISLSVIGGGVITLCIVITAAASLHGIGSPVASLNDLAPTVQPVLGEASTIGLGVGFFAAGLSSAMTAPLAAAYAVTEIVPLSDERKDRIFRWTWQLVLGAGIIFASLSFKPLQLILIAQIANGILLPVIALFILWVANDRTILREHVNGRLQNLLGLLVLSVTVMLGTRSIFLALGWL